MVDKGGIGSVKEPSEALVVFCDVSAITLTATPPTPVPLEFLTKPEIAA
jgi:hypothetical protein